jgi:HD-like signal output (HDOD) protein/signal transduction histidine kinase
MAAPSINSAKILDVGRLPSMPHVLLKLMQACYREDVSFGELSDILKMDTALSSRIVAVGNSPLYAQWNGVKDFNRLLIALGINAIRNIAVTAAVHQFFSRIDEDLDACLNNFWRSSLTCAHAAKSLARITGYPSEEEAFLTGLIHKVGQLALLNYAAVSYTRILMGAASEQELIEREREQFGTGSPEVGAMLLETWGLDTFLADAVLYQHEPAETLLDAAPLVKLINISHKLGEREWYAGDLAREVDLLFGLGQPMLDELLAEVEGKVTETAKALGIRLKSGGGEAEVEKRTAGQQIKVELQKQIHDITLLDGARQQFLDGKDMEAVLEIVMQNLQLLFSLPQAICFLYDHREQQLDSVAWCTAHKESECEFQIPLQADRSLIADCLLQTAQLCSFDAESVDSLAVVDRQLIRILGAQGMICLPLIADQEKVGVLAVGVNREQYHVLDEKSKLLGLFCGEAARALWRMQSVTEDQQEMLGAERTRAVQQARMTLHEVNNPLAIINNYLEVLGAELGGEHKAQQQIGILKEEIERVGKILLRAGEPPREETALQQGEVDLNASIRDLVSIFKASLFTTHGITEELDLDESLLPLASNRNKVKQVLTNLFKNAAEAMENGGRITVSTKGQVNVDGRPFVELTIRDSGPGIPGSIMPNLFSPVQSTKGKGHSGLGLTIVKNLVTELSGTISCSSDGERGTEFRILLPVSRKGSAKRNQP